MSVESSGTSHLRVPRQKTKKEKGSQSFTHVTLADESAASSTSRYPKPKAIGDDSDVQDYATRIVGGSQSSEGEFPYYGE